MQQPQPQQQRHYTIQQPQYQEQKQQSPMSRTQAMQLKAQSPPSRGQHTQPLSAAPQAGASPSPFFGTFFPAGANLSYMPSPPMLPPAVAPAGGFASAQAMQAYMMRLSQQIAQQQQQLGWMQQPQFAAGGGGLPLVPMPPMLLPPAVMFSPSNGPATDRPRAPPDFSLDKLPSFSPDRSSNGNATARGSSQAKPRRRKTEQLHHMATPPLLPAAFHPAFHASPHQLQQQEKQQLNVRSPVLSPRASGRPSTLAALPTFVLLDAILQTPEFSGQQFSSTGSPPSKSRKTLSSHANMRVAYSASGPAAARAARRASDIASESLAAGLPVQIVSSLREAGLVSTLFSPTGNTEAPRGSMTNDGSDRAFPWNMTADSQQQNGEAKTLNRLPSLKRTASTTDANAAASPAPTAGTSVTATPADSGAASPKGSLSTVSSPKQSNGAASAGSSPSKPAVATLQLPATASPGGATKDANAKRRLSFMVTSPDNNVRTLAEDDAGLAEVDRLASALAAMQTSPGSSIDASAAVSPDGSVAGTAVPSTSASSAVSAAVSPTASVVPSTEVSRAASPTAEARRLVLRPSRDGPGLPPDSNPPEEHQSGIIYITREVSSSKKRVTLLNPAVTAAEKAEKAAKEKERLRRYAERDQKKREAEEEKKYRQAEAEAAKESRAAARERMKNHLAEQGIQRQKEKEAREKAEREAALAAERAAAEEEKANPSKPRPGVPSFLARIARTKQDAAETEARTKLRQELNPEIEEGTEEEEAAAAEAEDGEQVGPLGTHKRSKKGSDGGMDSESAAAVPERESRRMSRLPTSSRILSLADPKRATASAALAKKKPLLLVSLRMINAAKRGDVDELRKILSEEFGGSGTNKAADKNKSGETRAEFLNRPDKNGSSALFHAVWPGHEAFMALLLEEGASPNYQNTRRNTVMHLAVERGHDSIVRLLLRHGANPLISNQNNHASFQVLPNTREQLQWASFIYITLEAIWKQANPNWVPDEEAAAAPTPATTDGAAATTNSVGNSPVLASAATSPDTVSPITPDAAKPAATSTPTDGDADASKSSAIDAGSDEMHVLDDSQDHTVLSSLSPNTPMWLNELYQIFQRKDASRTHTKHLQTKVLGIMRMTSGFKGIAAVAAAAAAKSKHAAANKEAANKEALVNSGGANVTFDSSSSSSSAAPGPRSSLTSSSGGGLANLLKQMKRSSKKSTKKTGSIDSTASTGSGKDGAGGGGSGKSSARGSLEVANNQASSGPNTRRRGSTEFTSGGAPVAPGSSSRRSHHVKGASGSPPLSSRSSATATIVMPNVSIGGGGSASKTRDRVGSPTAGHRALSPTPSTTAIGAAGTSPAAAPASAAVSAESPAPAPAPAPVAAVLFPSASSVPAPTAAKVKTFSIFSASVQDMDEPANKRGSQDKQAGFSIWKKTFETTPSAPPARR